MGNWLGSGNTDSYNYLFRMWRRWFVVILLLVFPFFFIGGADYYDPRSVKEFWNLGHLFFFAMFALVLDSYWWAQNRSIFFRILFTFFILLFVGVGIELIQLNITSRSCSLSDVVRDLSGGAIVLFWKASRRQPPLQAILSGFLLIIIVSYNFAPLLLALTDEYRSYKAFPLLAGFECEAEFRRWTSGPGVGFHRVSAPRLQGGYSGQITLTTDKYSGVSLDHFPRDWSGKRGLAFSVFNPGRQIVLHYRVHDSQHNVTEQRFTDRYNGKTVLEHGWNEIIIPMADIINGLKGRKMDITKISGFGIFVMNQNERRILFLDNVRLL
ncbi:VanZ family protein [Desulfopila sp. IMCC35006]|uniref:VanZ family protein n=1 Tax=Desulfopila sp. IMCC35006 TaxID=2569542 RepID=UPI0010ABF57E|nr:VanZ family protein [Desulfopila sp. IMCC35006]TKB23980.1 VanZ family protein [Desulfopila sp. IMCC35006]